MKNNSITIPLIFVAVIAFMLFGYAYTNNKSDIELADVTEEVKQEETMSQDLPKTNDTNPIVTFKTSMGDISLELYIDKAPITAGNFVKLAEEGLYTNTKFHRVIDGFMIQGGDPNTKGDDVGSYGIGGPGYAIEDEFAEGLSNVAGTLSMANSGPNTGGSQFFINNADNIFLDGKHAVFGSVVGGMDAINSIIKVETTGSPTDRPLEPIIVEEVVVTLGESSEAEKKTINPVDFSPEI